MQRKIWCRFINFGHIFPTRQPLVNSTVTGAETGPHDKCLWKLRNKDAY